MQHRPTPILSCPKAPSLHFPSSLPRCFTICTPKTSARRDDRLGPAPQMSEHRAGPQMQLAAGGGFLQASGSSVILSRVISPVQPVRNVGEEDHSMACSCGYTLVTVQYKGVRSNLPIYRVVGAHTCGRGVSMSGKRCKHHQGAPQFEVWRVRQVTGSGEGGAGGHRPSVQPLRQAMLVFSCNSLQQLESFFGLHQSNQKLQLEDHWGAPGGKMEHHLVRPGLPLQPNAEEPLPAWKRAQRYTQVKRANARTKGLQVHSQEQPLEQTDPPPFNPL